MIDQRIDDWYLSNTFHADDFKTIEALVDLKRSGGVRISLGLPALNESKTIGRIVACLQEELLGRYKLLDEIVVVDGGSSDDTVAIARSAGASVIDHQQILPEVGTFAGKGEALWHPRTGGGSSAGRRS